MVELGLKDAPDAGHESYIGLGRLVRVQGSCRGGSNWCHKDVVFVPFTAHTVSKSFLPPPSSL